jgi:exportin-2 (importin alpha re-exporter)
MSFAPAGAAGFSPQPSWGVTRQTACNAMQFLTSVAEKPQYKAIFAAEGTLQALCEKVVVPNMQFRPCDEEIFETDPDEYIRRDMEGSDIDTRRRGACDLVRGLCSYWEPEVTTIFSGYIQLLLQNYSSNPQQQWASKDAAIFLVTSLAVRGRVQSKGATATNELVPILEFFHSQILPDLQVGCLSQALPLGRALMARDIMLTEPRREQSAGAQGRCSQVCGYISRPGAG